MNKPSRSRFIPSSRTIIKRCMTVFTLLLVALSLMGARIVGCGGIDPILTPDGAPTMDAIKVGLIYTAPRRNSTRYGAELAAIQINQEGGVRGIPVELIARDNRNDAEHTAELAEELITSEGASAVIGPNFSRHAVIVAEIAQSHEIPMISTSATNPTITDAGDFVFMAAFTDDFQGKVMAQFAAQELRASSAAVLTQAGDVFSEGLSQTFVDNFTAFGGAVVRHEFYTAGDTDFTAQLTAIAQFAPDVIFMPGFVPDVPRAIQQARTIPQPNATGITATFLGADSWDDPELLSMGSQVVEGSFFSSAFSAAPPTSGQTGATLSGSARQFIAAYQSVFGVPPDGPGALGYDALKLVVQAMRRADRLAPDAVRDQIAATSGYSGATTLIGYDSNRHATKSAVILRIQGGRVRFHQQIEP